MRIGIVIVEEYWFMSGRTQVSGIFTNVTNAMNNKLELCLHMMIREIQNETFGAANGILSSL